MLKAFRINEYDVYAGRDLEEAIAACMAVTGMGREDACDPMFCYEMPPSAKLLDDDDRETTIGAVLAEMDKPGVVCGFED